MEYRQSKRVPARLTLLIYRKGTLVATGMLRNISNSGLFISTRCPNLAPNEELEIEFDLHDRNSRGNQRIKAQLVHRNHVGIGARFSGGERRGTPELRSLLNWVGETNLLIGRPRTERVAAC